MNAYFVVFEANNKPRSFFYEYVKLAKGVLLGYDNGYILKTTAGIDVFNNIESIELPELPEGFFTLPTLNWKVHS
jgi:hypothetical protein